MHFYEYLLISNLEENVSV